MKIKVPCPFCLQRLGRVSCTCEDCCGSGSVEIEVPERRSTPNETSTRAGGCLPRYVRDLESSARTAVEHATEPVVGPETEPTTVATSRRDVLVSAIERTDDIKCSVPITLASTHPATPERRFPILGTTFSIPWSLVGPHELQAQRNHYQTLERLAERGGVDSLEALYIILDEKWEPGHLPITSARVAQKILERWCDLREVK